MILGPVLFAMLLAGGSSAQETCIATGDVNCSGDASISDVLTILNYFQSPWVPAPPCPYQMNVNGDCLVDIVDINILIPLLVCVDCLPVEVPTCCDPVLRPCCLGDPNQSWSGPTIGDVSAMVNAKFVVGTCESICVPGADINRSGGDDPTCEDITVSDIAMLVDCLFVNGDRGPCIEPCETPFWLTPAGKQALLEMTGQQAP